MSEVFALALAHLRLVAMALGLAAAIGLSLGVASAMRPRLERALLAVTSLIQTVPAIALLAVMVPLLGWIADTTGAPISSIGEGPALVALTLYALLPIVRGVVTGLRGIDPAVTRAAHAVGMDDAERLRRVDLPLAAPSILGGLRTAAVWTVGMATLATPVGGTSLGNLIFGGLQTRHFGDVLLGCAAAAAMALAIDAALAWAERRSHGQGGARALQIALVVLAVLAVTALGARSWRTERATVHIGAKSFTEQLVLAELLRCALGDEPVEVHPSLGTTVAFDALEAGDLDVYVEYTGTAWSTILGRTETIDREAMRERVRRALVDEHHVHEVARLGFENAYAIVVRGDERARRISDLGDAHARSIGGDYELFTRPEWRALETSYGLRPREQRTMDPSLLYEALRTGAVDAIGGYTTDGRIAAMGLRVLEDDRSALPPYDAIVLVSDRLARERPELVDRLRALEGTVDAEAMRAANDAVDGGRATPREAARSFAACRR